MVISVCKFLAMYYGIALDAGMEYSHKMLKRHFRFLRTRTLRYAANHVDLIKNGRLIYVRDSYGAIIPYEVPDKIMISLKDCEYSEAQVEETFNDKSILEDLNELPTYIVHELLSKYKDAPSFYKVIKRELMARGTYENKKYKLRKEIIEIGLEESEFNDKYQRRRKIKYKKP